jgi:uncharacterized protein YbjT (DUF2867 family)
MILVTGATGNIGRELIRLLHEKEIPFRAMARDPEKARGLQEEGWDVVLGDYDTPESLVTAVLDVEKLFLLSPAGPDLVHHQSRLVDAASRAGVKSVVKVSALGADPDAPTLLGRLQAESEQMVAASGLAFTHLRPHFLMQNMLMFAPTISTENAFYAPMKDGRIGLVDARDIATVAASVLTEDSHAGHSYDLTGPEALSFFDLAEKFSAVRKRQISYVDIPPARAREGMLRAGTPAWLADSILEQYEQFRQGRGEIVTDTIHEITGQRPRGFDEFAVDYAGPFAKRRAQEE